MAISIKSEIRVYRHAIGLEKIYPRFLRQVVKALLYVSTVALFTVLLFYVLEASLSVGYFAPGILLVESGKFFFGLFLMSFSLLFLNLMLTFFYNSRYYRGIESIVNDDITSSKRGLTYEVAEMLTSSDGDITERVFNSKYGIEILERCNIKKGQIKRFLDDRGSNVPLEVLDIPDEGFLTIEKIAKIVYNGDDDFKDFLFKQGVTEDDFNGSVEWSMDAYHHSKNDSRWWSKDSLGRVPVIGNDWAYGGAYLLDQYSRDIRTSAVFSVLSSNVAYADEKIDQIESILDKSQNANVMVVGERGVGKMDIIMRLSKRIAKGDVPTSLVKKRLVVFDGDSFIARNETKEEFESNLIDLFKQTANAGNIIVVIDNFSNFLESSATLGANATALLDEYLASPQIHIIGTSDPQSFHKNVETKQGFSQRFGVVHIENPDLSSTIAILQSIANKYEKRHKLLFTYPSIHAIAETAERFIMNGVMPDKAVSLLSEIAPHAGRHGIEHITKEYVYEYVSVKTGIPAGPVKEEERDMLLNLESVLHERVIGQDHAVSAISGVMRRVRAGIQDEHRPLGSFMFLGSTGVGKTETAKALAQVFFGSEESISRVDMSEYSGVASLERLIGGEHTIGALTILLKEKPYGVLLLDEFEKADATVHDLFLQIIDEGFFTDSHGSKINVRNNIIIATSNAGAQIIWELAKERKNPSNSKDDIIENIIREGVYKPELVNRFDGVVIFEPLDLKSQEKIARMMLDSLKERIQKKGYELVVDEVLVNLLTTKGYDPEFGARPMRRVMQDIIEEKVAQKIIEGKIKKGDKIWFYEEDFKDV